MCVINGTRSVLAFQTRAVCVCEVLAVSSLFEPALCVCVRAVSGTSRAG